MALFGSLECFSLPEVLQLIALGKKSELLSVHGKTDVGKILIHKGRVVYASCQEKSKLGDLLVEKGVLRMPELDAVLAEKEEASDHRLLGTLLYE